jgi:hypothetical protein
MNVLQTVMFFVYHHYDPMGISENKGKSIDPFAD